MGVSQKENNNLSWGLVHTTYQYISDRSCEHRAEWDLLFRPYRYSTLPPPSAASPCNMIMLYIWNKTLQVYWYRKSTTSFWDTCDHYYLLVHYLPMWTCPKVFLLLLHRQHLWTGRTNHTCHYVVLIFLQWRHCMMWCKTITLCMFFL